MISFLPIAILAYALNAGSTIVDKILLNKSLPSPYVYVFYINILGLLALFLLPFGVTINTPVLVKSFLSGVLFVVGLVLLFKSLKHGEASVVTPVVGALNPLFTFLIGSLFLHQALQETQITALFVLIFGAMVLTSELWFTKLKANKQLLIMIASGLAFALSYIFLKQVFDASNFITGLVLTRLFGGLVVLTFLVLPSIRKQIFHSNVTSNNFANKTTLFLIFGQIMGAISGLMLSFAISLTNPAIVNSLFGVQYIVILAVALILYKKSPTLLDERLTGLVILKKVLGIIILSFGLYLLTLQTIPPAQNIKIGVTFSPNQAENLGLDWKTTYLDILDNLKIRNLRLTSHWTSLEPADGKFFFDDLDYQLNEAHKRNANIILVVGVKQPGWPECYIPGWAKNLTLASRKQKTLDFIRGVVERYRDNPAIRMWQVENEPLFNYGANCDPADAEFLKKEVKLVKNLDPIRPVLITDSGELSLWIVAMQQGDIFGTTMYRTVNNPLLGNFTYPLSPALYNLHSRIIRNIFAKQNQKTIITELQAEPWFSKALTQVSIDKQVKTFPVQELAKNVEFAKATGFDEMYLWGAEWWYFMNKFGYPEYLEYAKTLFK